MSIFPMSFSTAFFPAAETSEMLIVYSHVEIILRYILICQDTYKIYPDRYRKLTKSPNH
jgi:hypothetical protein